MIHRHAPIEDNTLLVGHDVKRTPMKYRTPSVENEGMITRDSVECGNFVMPVTKTPSPVPGTKLSQQMSVEALTFMVSQALTSLVYQALTSLVSQALTSMVYQGSLSVPSHLRPVAQRRYGESITCLSLLLQDVSGSFRKMNVTALEPVAHWFAS